MKDAIEQRTVRRITALRKTGASTRAIAATLNAEGRTTKRGKQWASASVSDVLTNARTNNRTKVV